MQMKHSLLALAIAATMTGCIHEDHDTLNPTTPPSVETPKLPANPSIPADAPTVPNKPAPNTAFKVSIDLVAASKTASSPLLVGDDASVAIAAQTARSEVKELKVKLKAEDFTRGYAIVEIDGLAEGAYTMTNTISQGDMVKFKGEPAEFDVIVPTVEIDYGLAVKNWSTLWAPLDVEDPVYDLMTEAKLEKARASSEGFTKDNAEHLWANLPLYKVTEGKQHVHEKNTKASFMRLFDMAVAYKLGGEFATQETLDNILFGIDFLLADFYNENLDQHPKDNWHEWEIGTPKFMHDTVSLIYEHVPADMMQKVINASRYHQKDPRYQYGESSPHNQITTTGANRVDAALIVLQRGVFDKNDAEIKLALDSIPDVLDPVITKDGFYEDGSFIQHQDLPYIGTYGMILLSNISRIMVMIDDTNITLDDERYALVDQYLMKSVAPFLYKAQMMDSVNGRAIARGWSQNKGEGRGALSVLLRYYDSRQGDFKAQLGGLIKEQLQTDQDVFFTKATDFKVLDVAQRILDDANIQPAGEIEGNFVFHNMDRVVHRKDGFAFTLALHSNRIGNYECGAGNTENTQAWYTADGMTYLYDADHSQYTDWWPLIDPRHMAGTTTTGENIGNCKGRNTYANKKKDMTWVGGVSNGEFGVYGANFVNSNIGVAADKYFKTTAKKSYFMFDDEIVMVGSDVQSTKTWGVSTVIENRKLNADGSNVITVDGSVWSPKADAEKILVNDTYHVEGNVEGSQMGVYLPTKKTAELMWDQRNGNWSTWYPANNNNMDDVNVSGYTLLSKMPHTSGTGKVDDYAYVLLPTHTAAETVAYGEAPDVKVLVQTAQAHAVEETTRGVFAANIFTTEAVANEHFASEGEFSVMTEKKGNVMHVWLSQPTRTNASVKVKFMNALSSNIQEDKDNRVEWVDGYWQIKTDGLNGAPYHFTYTL